MPDESIRRRFSLCQKKNTFANEKKRSESKSEQNYVFLFTFLPHPYTFGAPDKLLFFAYFSAVLLFICVFIAECYEIEKREYWCNKRGKEKIAHYVLFAKRETKLLDSSLLLTDLPIRICFCLASSFREFYNFGFKNWKSFGARAFFCRCGPRFEFMEQELSRKANTTHALGRQWASLVFAEAIWNLICNMFCSERTMREPLWKIHIDFYPLPQRMPLATAILICLFSLHHPRGKKQCECEREEVGKSQDVLFWNMRTSLCAIKLIYFLRVAVNARAIWVRVFFRQKPITQNKTHWTSTSIICAPN